MLDSIRFVYFTNEKNTFLIPLLLKNFFKHNNGLKVSVICNKFYDEEYVDRENVQYLNGNVNFSYSGHHFGKSLVNCLPSIEEDYILFLCDDYFFVRDTKKSQLNDLLKFIKKHNVDYFGFDEMEAGFTERSTLFETDDFDIGKGHIYNRTSDYRYLFSVQPSIWKKTSLISLVNKFPDISLHNLDETLPIIKEQNTFFCLFNDLHSCYNFVDLNTTEYFVIAYYELIRHGCFWVPENGHYMSPSEPYVKFIYDMIEEEGLKNNKKFKTILHNIK